MTHLARLARVTSQHLLQTCSINESTKHVLNSSSLETRLDSFAQLCLHTVTLLRNDVCQNKPLSKEADSYGCFANDGTVINDTCNEPPRWTPNEFDYHDKCDE